MPISLLLLFAGFGLWWAVTELLHERFPNLARRIIIGLLSVIALMFVFGILTH